MAVNVGRSKSGFLSCDEAPVRAMTRQTRVAWLPRATCDVVLLVKRNNVPGMKAAGRAFLGDVPRDTKRSTKYQRW